MGKNKAPQEMAIKVVYTVDVRMEMLDPFMEMMNEIVTETRKETLNLKYELIENPTSITAWKVEGCWTNRAGLKQHKKTRHFAQWTQFMVSNGFAEYDVDETEFDYKGAGPATAPVVETREEVYERGTNQFGGINESVIIQSEVDTTVDDVIPAELENALYSPEEKAWNKRVMRWVQANRSVYLKIKTVQFSLSLLLLGISIILFFKWRHTKPDFLDFTINNMIIMLLSFDCAVYLTDYVMVIKRWRFFITLRHILSCISLAIATMIFMDFAEEEWKSDGVVAFDFHNAMEAWILGIILYMLQSYLVFCVLNMVISFQIKEMEKQDARVRKVRLSN